MSDPLYWAFNYIGLFPDGWLKIGHSAAPRRRVGNVGRYHGAPVTLLWYRQDEYAWAVDEYVQQILHAYRWGRFEIYDVSFATAVLALNRARAAARRRDGHVRRVRWSPIPQRL